MSESIETAKQYIADENYEEALKNINIAISISPNEERLLENKKIIENNLYN